MTHADLLLAILARTPAPSSVEGLTAAMVAEGFHTTDKLGAGHQVRTILQRLKGRGLAVWVSRDCWAISPSAKAQRGPLQPPPERGPGAP